ncbi:hypothetical protein A2W24_03820 [Microgenomates group bacterium RBG_16_45_19]|nr:MAG: hypothetical protein A2W24_03820 [Microgenomates group bacterium RBG_16_45_19]
MCACARIHQETLSDNEPKILNGGSTDLKRGDSDKMKKLVLISIVLVAILVVAGYVAFVYYPGITTTHQGNVLRLALVDFVQQGSAYADSMSYGIDEAVKALNSTERPIIVSKSFGIQVAELKSVIEGYIAQGCNLIVVPEVLIESVGVELADKYPKVNFLGGGGWSPTDVRSNVAVYAWDLYKGYYLAGIIAGAVTEKNLIGWMSAFDFPDNARLYNMLMAGARAINPNVKGVYLFTGDWSDPVKGASAADALVDAGADVVVPAGDGMTEGAIAELGRKGVYTIGYNWDQKHLAPNVVLTSVLYNTTAYIITAIKAIDGGTFGNSYWTMGLGEGIAKLAPYNTNLEQVIPQQAKNMINSIMDQVSAGTFKLPVVNGTMPPSGT